MSQSPDQLALVLLTTRHSPEGVSAAFRRVYQAVLAGARHIKTGNFTALAGDDVETMFTLIDGAFYGGGLRLLLELVRCSISFHASSRLTRSGGLTKQFRPRGQKQIPFVPGCRYEIVLSSTLLFQTFQDVSRPVHVSGLLCADRLEAALRIMEHETVHLLEMIAVGTSSCDREPFKAMARGVFGHTLPRHDLVTQGERAREKHGLKVGDQVKFAFEGRMLVGLLNRITRRATVLVEDAKGQLYTSGKRYLKFYIPLGMLLPVNGGSAAPPS